MTIFGTKVTSITELRLNDSDFEAKLEYIHVCNFNPKSIIIETNNNNYKYIQLEVNQIKELIRWKNENEQYLENETIFARYESKVKNTLHVKSDVNITLYINPTNNSYDIHLPKITKQNNTSEDRISEDNTKKKNRVRNGYNFEHVTLEQAFGSRNTLITDAHRNKSKEQQDKFIELYVEYVNNCKDIRKQRNITTRQVEKELDLLDNAVYRFENFKQSSVPLDLINWIVENRDTVKHGDKIKKLEEIHSELGDIIEKFK